MNIREKKTATVMGISMLAMAALASGCGAADSTSNEDAPAPTASRAPDAPSADAGQPQLALPMPTQVAPAADASLPDAQTVPADPDGLSSSCVALTMEANTKFRLTVFSLDGAALLQGPQFTMLGAGNNGSLAVAGGNVFVCSNGKLGAIDLATGLFQQTQVACSPVTSNEDGIWSVQYPSQLKRFAGAAELLTQTPAAAMSIPVQQPLGRFGPGGAGRIYASGGAGSTAYRIETATGTGAATATPISLEGLGNSQIFGISAAAGNRIAVATSTNFSIWGVQVFDGTTGKRLAHLHPTLTFVGLSCRE